MYIKRNPDEYPVKSYLSNKFLIERDTILANYCRLETKISYLNLSGHPIVFDIEGVNLYFSIDSTEISYTFRNYNLKEFLGVEYQVQHDNHISIKSGDFIELPVFLYMKSANCEKMHELIKEDVTFNVRYSILEKFDDKVVDEKSTFEYIKSNRIQIKNK